MKLLQRFALLVMILGVLSGSYVAQESEPPAETEDPLQLHLQELELAAIEQRGLELTQEIDRLFPSREEVQAYISGQLEGDEIAQQFVEARQFYVGFGFIDPELDLLTTYQDFLDNQIGGYYDPETLSMNTILLLGGELGERLPVTERIIYVHEFTHALQDAHFDLGNILEIIDSEMDNPDRAQAIISLVEGDASFVMNEYTVQLTQENPIGVLIGILSQGAASGTLVIPEEIPDIIGDELMSPYIDGANFVQALYDAGGWETVNNAYTVLPASTEQILHPQKYLDGEMPVEVSLNASEGLLGDEWSLVFERTLGEFFLRKYLEQSITGGNARTAAAGWGGDSYQLFHNEATDQHAWVLKLVWDSELDATQFADTMKLITDAEVLEGCHSGDAQILCFASVDDVTSLISVAPSQEIAQTLIDNQQ